MGFTPGVFRREATAPSPGTVRQDLHPDFLPEWEARFCYATSSTRTVDSYRFKLEEAG